MLSGAPVDANLDEDPPEEAEEKDRMIRRPGDEVVELNDSFL